MPVSGRRELHPTDEIAVRLGTEVERLRGVLAIIASGHAADPVAYADAALRAGHDAG